MPERLRPAFGFGCPMDHFHVQANRPSQLCESMEKDLATSSSSGSNAAVVQTLSIAYQTAQAYSYPLKWPLSRQTSA